MPVLHHSTYKPPFLFANGHIQSAYPVYFRTVPGIQYRRERITTPDADFLDLDWSKTGADRVVILLHGLEGHSYRAYMVGMIKAFNRRGWDAVAMNFRGCSGEPNRLLISYHYGKTDDLHTVVSHIDKTGRYKAIALVGFSLGANVILKYLGDGQFPVVKTIVAAAGFSAPCDLTSCSWKLARLSHRLYMQRFLKMLHRKIAAKAALFPDKINDNDFTAIKNFKQFDDRYTAPIHGFSGAEDYWTQCSTTQFLTAITVPTLIVNALDDPFLTDKCFYLKEAERNCNVFLETPKSGGHVGFVTFGKSGEYWSETRAAEFCNGHLTVYETWKKYP